LSPFKAPVVEYVAFVSPLIKVPGTVPLYHWYLGAAPSLLGVAVNVTFAPGQIVPVGAVIAAVTDGVTFAFTVIVTLFVSEAGLAQPKLLVIFTVITSPFTSGTPLDDEPLVNTFVVEGNVPCTEDVHT